MTTTRAPAGERSHRGERAEYGPRRAGGRRRIARAAAAAYLITAGVRAAVGGRVGRGRCVRSGGGSVDAGSCVYPRTRIRRSRIHARIDDARVAAAVGGPSVRRAAAGAARAYRRAAFRCPRARLAVLLAAAAVGIANGGRALRRSRAR